MGRLGTLKGRRRTHSNQDKSPPQLSRQSFSSTSSSNASASSPTSSLCRLKRSTTPELERIEKGPVVDMARSQSLADFSTCSGSSLSTVEDLGADDHSPKLVLIDGCKSEDPLWKKRRKISEPLDVDKYMASRVMTPNQERMNAITVIPGAFYCFLFLLSGAWLDKSLVEEVREEITNANYVDESGCLSSSWWMPHLHALPPLPVVAAALGVILHAPFSFLYHWHYAHRLPPGLARTTHWSRRLDQAMIHVCSASMAYATSGRLDFFMANLLFNMDCIYRQFKTSVRPRRNQIRIFISVVAYTIPILRRGDMELFLNLWALFGVSFWLFGAYPIRGWSHSAFHLCIAFVPHLLMVAALELPASQDQLKVAAQCAVVAKQSLES